MGKKIKKKMLKFFFISLKVVPNKNINTEKSDIQKPDRIICRKVSAF